jgi:hypothetical protein
MRIERISESGFPESNFVGFKSITKHCIEFEDYITITEHLLYFLC